MRTGLGLTMLAALPAEVPPIDIHGDAAGLPVLLLVVASVLLAGVFLGLDALMLGRVRGRVPAGPAWLSAALLVGVFPLVLFLAL